MQRDLSLLEDILVAAADVNEFYGALTRESFVEQKALRLAILHSLTIIGEAAARLTEELRTKHPDVPWRRIIAFRNRLVHGYGDLDLDLVWEISGKLVPVLRDKIAAIRVELSSPE